EGRRRCRLHLRTNRWRRRRRRARRQHAWRRRRRRHRQSHRTRRCRLRERRRGGRRRRRNARRRRRAGRRAWTIGIRDARRERRPRRSAAHALLLDVAEGLRHVVVALHHLRHLGFGVRRIGNERRKFRAVARARLFHRGDELGERERGTPLV